VSSTRSSNSVHFTLSAVMAAAILLVAPLAVAQTPAQPRRSAQATTRQPGGGGRAPSVGLPGTGTATSQQPRGRPSAARATARRAGARPSASGARGARRGGGGAATSVSFGIGGGGIGGGGISSAGGGMASGGFEPYRNEPIDWKEIPDEGKQILQLDAASRRYRIPWVGLS